MRAASWLMGMFLAATMSARAFLPVGVGATARLPIHRQPGRSGSRAKVTAASVKRRSRKLTAIAREKRRQRRAQR